MQWIKDIKEDCLGHSFALRIQEGLTNTICPLHFKDFDFDVVEGTQERLLKENAIPTIFPWSKEWISLPSVQVRASTTVITSVIVIYMPSFVYFYAEHSSDPGSSVVRLKK